MVPTSSQDEALARYGVSREVPGSVLKCETVPDSFHATPKSPPHAGFPRGYILAAKAAAIAEGGIILDIPMHHCYKEIIRGELVPVLNGWHVPQLENYIACTVESSKIKRVQLFLEWFVQRRREIEIEMKHRLQQEFGLKI